MTSEWISLLKSLILIQLPEAEKKKKKLHFGKNKQSFAFKNVSSFPPLCLRKTILWCVHGKWVAFSFLLLGGFKKKYANS